MVSGWEVARWVLIGFALAMPLVGLPLLRGRELYLFSVAAALSLIAVFVNPQSEEIFLKALERAGFVASFLLLMGLLRDGALTSKAVGICGAYVTRQPAQRRFLGVFAGSHFFAVLINLGALSLLAPIIQRGVRQDRGLDQPLDAIDAVRERRQLVAALRGFSWFLVWAPTAVTQAVLPGLIPGIDPFRLIALGLLVAVVMLLVSWAEDTFRWLPLKRRLARDGMTPRKEPLPFPAAAFRNLGLIAVVLFGLTLTFTLLGSLSLIGAVMLSAPIVVIGWIFIQCWDHNPGTAIEDSAARLSQIGLREVPGGVREASSVAAAGYIGTLAAALIPLEVLLDLQLETLPTWVLLGLLSVLVWLGGQVALSPITMAVFLGGVLSAYPELPADPTLLALAIAAGTAICTTGSPFASGTLLLSRASGYSGATLTWRWNAAYTAVATAVLVALFFLLS